MTTFLLVCAALLVTAVVMYFVIEWITKDMDK